MMYKLLKCIYILLYLSARNVLVYLTHRVCRENSYLADAVTLSKYYVIDEVRSIIF